MAARAFGRVPNSALNSAQTGPKPASVKQSADKNSRRVQAIAGLRRSATPLPPGGTEVEWKRDAVLVDIPYNLQGYALAEGYDVVDGPDGAIVSEVNQ